MRINNSKSAKRKEEELKLVLNWVFRHLKEQFGRNLNVDCNIDNLFTNHYFKSDAERIGQSINWFLKPKFRKKTKKGPRSFNKNFIHAIRQSETFTRDLKLALQSHFVPDMLCILQTRLKSLLGQWEDMVSRLSEESRFTECFKYKIQIKTKIPWCFQEILHARDTLISEMDLNN